MPTNFRVNGYDFDDLFDPYVSGPRSQDTSFRVDGTDLSQRYAHIQFGQKRQDVGYQVAGGMDVSNLWAAKGSASYVIEGLNGKRLSAYDGAATNQSQVMARVSVSMMSDGRWQVSGNTTRGAVSQPAPAIGTWLPAGTAVANYQVMFVVSASGGDGHSVSNSAPGFTSLTGTQAATLTLPAISAVNTITRNASFQVQIHLRNASTGSVSVTSLSGSVGSNGWV